MRRRVGDEVVHWDQEADFHEHDCHGHDGQTGIRECAQVDAAPGFLVRGQACAEEEDAGGAEEGAHEAHDPDGPGEADAAAEVSDEEGEDDAADAAGGVGQTCC